MQEWKLILKADEEKLSFRKPQPQTFEENGIRFYDQESLNEYKNNKDKYPNLTQRLQNLYQKANRPLNLGATQMEIDNLIRESRQPNPQQSQPTQNTTLDDDKPDESVWRRPAY